MTVGSSFLDTNILLYAALGRTSEPEKWARSRQIVVEEAYCTSGQVLAEFYANAVKGKNQGKQWTPLSPEQAQKWVRALAKKPCQDITRSVVFAGIDHAQAYQISYWDGAIIAAAETLGAKIVYSEDLSHQQMYGAVQVINPFL